MSDPRPASNALVTVHGDLSLFLAGRLSGSVSPDGGWIVVDGGDRVEIPPGHGVLIVDSESGTAEVSLYPLDLDAFRRPFEVASP